MPVARLRQNGRRSSGCRHRRGAGGPRGVGRPDGRRERHELHVCLRGKSEKWFASHRGQAAQRAPLSSTVSSLGAWAHTNASASALSFLRQWGLFLSSNGARLPRVHGWQVGSLALGAMISSGAKQACTCCSRNVAMMGGRVACGGRAQLATVLGCGMLAPPGSARGAVIAQIFATLAETRDACAAPGVEHTRGCAAVTLSQISPHRRRPPRGQAQEAAAPGPVGEAAQAEGPQ